MKDKNKLLSKLKEQRDKVAVVAEKEVLTAQPSHGKKQVVLDNSKVKKQEKVDPKKANVQSGKANGNINTKPGNNTVEGKSGSTGGAKQTPLQQKLQDKLQGGQFRWLNEKLYTTTSDEAFKFMSESPELFTTYHEGFRIQVENWPVNPVDVFVKHLKQNPKLVAGDFGCGDAKIAESVRNKVHSFDLVAHNERVTACDMSKVPLANNTLDIAIFSLSLMGTNFLQFIKEAHRCLKLGGEMHIAEVRSRFEEQSGGIDKFIAAVEGMGFQKIHMDKNNKMFVMLQFKKAKTEKPKVKFNNGELLKPCIYKRR